MIKERKKAVEMQDLSASALPLLFRNNYSMNTIKQHIKTGEYKKVYLLYGTENYLKRLYADKLKNAVSDPSDSMNSMTFNGDTVDFTELMELCDTMPFLSERRFILVQRSGLFKAKKGSGEAEESTEVKSTSSDRDRFAEYIKQIPDTTVLVFVEDEVDKRSRIFKNVKECGYETEINTLSENDLRLWIATELKKNGKEITGATADYLVNYVGTDMEILSIELQKLCMYAYERNSITVADINEMCTKALSAAIFDLTDALAAGNKRKAFEVLDELNGMREPVQKTFISLLRHYTRLYVVKEMMQSNYSKSDIVTTLGIHPFAVGKLMSQAGRFSAKEIRNKMQYGVSLECDMKSGRLRDKNLIELFIAE